ncbi:hypothetical protein HK405_008549, partial [Cladochytrium tenue]
HLVLRAPKLMSHPLAKEDGVYFSEPLVLITLKLKKRMATSSSAGHHRQPSKIGSALSGVFKRSASAGSSLRSSPKPQSPRGRVFSDSRPPLSPLLNLGPNQPLLKRSGSAGSLSTKNLQKPRSTPELVTSAPTPPPTLSTGEGSASYYSSGTAGPHTPDSTATPTSPFFAELAARVSIDSLESEKIYWSMESEPMPMVSAMPPMPALPHNASGSNGAVRASTFPSAMPMTGAKTTAPIPVRRIGPAFDEHEAQLSSSRSARRKVVFKIVMPSREVVLVANNPADFREFRRFVEENRVRILSGASEERKSGGGGGGNGLDDDVSSIAEDESFSAVHTDGRGILRKLMDADESNRFCAGCGVPDPEWVALEHCSGVYRGHTNYIVRSFLFDVSLFRDHDSDIYQAVVSLVNSQSEAAILRAAELGDIPSPPLLLLHLTSGALETARSPTALSIESTDRPSSGLPPPPQQQQVSLTSSAVAAAKVGATAAPPPPHALTSGRFRRHRSHQVPRGGGPGSGGARGLFGLLTPSGSSHSIDAHAAPATPPPAAAVASAGGTGEGVAGSGGTGGGGGGGGLHFAISRLKGLTLRRDASHQTSSSVSSAASSSATTASLASTSASAPLSSTGDAGALAATATVAFGSAAPTSAARSSSFPLPHYARSDPGATAADPADPRPSPQPSSTALRARAASATTPGPE